MRFVLEALRHVLMPRGAFSITTLFAAGGMALATLIVIYGALIGTDDASAVADAVAVEGPVFTPVAMTPPAPMPAAKPSGLEAPSAPRFDDDRSLTRAVQAELRRADCYNGPINGVWTASTRAAMGEFTARVNARLPVDRADPVLLALLETHNKISCTADCSTGSEPSCVARTAEPRSEVASIERSRPSEARYERQPSSSSADDLGYSGDERRAPNPVASVQAASTESEEGMGVEDAAALTAAGAATHEVTKAKPRRSARKYRRKPSLSRSVSKGFRQLQRSLNKLF
jgi:hypothetical protein